MTIPFRVPIHRPLAACLLALAGGVALAATDLAAVDSAAGSPASAGPASALSAPAAQPTAASPPAASPPAGSPSSTSPPTASPYQPDRFSGRAGRFYASAWGIDGLSVKLVESGELIRFSYRVIDPEHAAPLNDKRLKPSLIDLAAGVSLVVPEMANVGMLRQTAAPQANRAYWVVFSNKGRLVKRGDRVEVVIGPFHATNLVVD